MRISITIDHAQELRRSHRVAHMPTKRHGERRLNARANRRRERAALRNELRGGGEA